MSGQKRKFFFGAVQEVSAGRVTTIPYVVGDVITGSESFAAGGFWPNHREVHVDSLETFRAVVGYRPRLTKASLNELKTIPEDSVKRAFADMIGEPHVPKDWGGPGAGTIETLAGGLAGVACRSHLLRSRGRRR